MGVKVPVGEVSVMPQPSARRRPLNFSNAFCTSIGSGAPPELHDLSEWTSAVLAAG